MRRRAGRSRERRLPGGAREQSAAHAVRGAGAGGPAEQRAPARRLGEWWLVVQARGGRGAKAAKECAGDTQTNCAGLTAYGHRSVETKENAESTGKGAPVWFHVYSFDTAENAGVAFKGLVANKRKQASQGGSPRRR